MAPNYLRRRPLPNRSGPIRLDLNDLKFDATAARQPQRTLVRDAGPLGRFGLRLRVIWSLARVIVLWFAIKYAISWLGRRLPRATGFVYICLICLGAAFVVGCFVYIEVTRRGRRGIFR